MRKPHTIVNGVNSASILLVLSIVPFAQAQNAEPACRIFETTGRNAESVALKIDKLTANVAARALDSGSVMVCAPEAMRPLLDQAIARLIRSEQQRGETHSARLYFTRNAPLLAPILDGVYAGIEVKPLGSDLLVFRTSNAAHESSIHELKRWIALIDTPRPEVALNVWSVQLTSSDPKEIGELSELVRTTVARNNGELQAAIERGWKYLEHKRQHRQQYAAPVFTGYITDRYVRRPANTPVSAYQVQACTESMYCLGFGDSFGPLLQPTLTNLLGVLAASNNPLGIGSRFVDCMENRPCDENAAAPKLIASDPPSRTCEEIDAHSGDGDHPLFTCFRDQLQMSFQPKRLALLRAAIADFLFQYKSSVQYPHDFNAYEYSVSAQSLDSQFDPLLVAFDRDVAVFLRALQGKLEGQQSGARGSKFISNGIITLRTISGTDSEVDTTTQNSFKNTPPPLVQDFVRQLGSAEKNTPALLQGSMGGQAATALTAFLNSGQSSTVTIGRGINLKVTPNSLQGAGAAELKIRLEAKDDGKPQVVTPDGNAKDDTTDRVAQHIVDTNIRVDALKLFEVSSLSAALSRGRQPIPLLPPFIELPYIGSFLHLRRSPEVRYHRSFAIVSAVVVPTAADLLSGIRFRTDTDITGLGEQALSPDFYDSIRRFHKDMLACIAWEANGVPDPCPTLRNDVR